jgi:ketosteroid isomerase-like protein
MNRFAGVMKLVAAIGLLGLTILMPGWAQSTGEIEQELLALQDQWASARVKGDVAFLETFYAKELRINTASGSVVERDADIALFASRAIKPEYIRDGDMNVSVYGDAAVVTGIENLKGTRKGVFGEMSLRFTNVFVRRDGRWQLVAHQSTVISKK